jgi:hypothetical protein
MMTTEFMQAMSDFTREIGQAENTDHVTARSPCFKARLALQKAQEALVSAQTEFAQANDRLLAAENAGKQP